MTCYHPLTLYRRKEGPLANGKWPLTNLQGGLSNKPVIVPCNKCWGCRLEYARQWAIRCMNEAQMHQDNCFLTLTYRDDELIYGGERYTLYPRHLQLFMKRLRKKYGNGIRFYACGEYGDKSGRPHYHALIFGLDFEDKKHHHTKDDYSLYSSSMLDSIWGHGHCLIGDVTFESASYVARYIMKKQTGEESKIYDDLGMVPEFTRMSRGSRKDGLGGIGTSWYKKFKKDVYPHDYVVIRGGMKCRPPKFYDGKYELDNPENMEYIKKRRQEMAEKQEDNHSIRRLNVKERVKKAQTESLKRSI